MAPGGWFNYILVFFGSIFLPTWATIQQVHLSFGYDETSMVVTWTVPEQTRPDSASVRYRCDGQVFNQTMSAPATVEHHQDKAATYNTYRALLQKLPVNQTCEYSVQMGNQTSEPYRFRTTPTGSKWLPRLAIYGDLGFVNERSIPYLKSDVQRDQYDAVFHIGDIAYDLPDDNGYVGHKFMRTIESVATRIPYMTCPGNHEEYNNFSHYDSRFSMLADRYKSSSHPPSHNVQLNRTELNNHFWSIDLGPAHIILFSTEYYYYLDYGWDQIERQYRWLERDLARANQNRHERPWVIVMAHRPLYCLKLGDDSCDHRHLDRPTIRQGIRWHGRGQRRYGLEDLFYKYGVDLQFYGHEHFYARMLPMYNYTVMAGRNSGNPYDHPEAPIHITTGSAGNFELHPPFSHHLKSWTACHFLDYGYTRLLFQDRYHIRLEQVSDDQGGVVLDSIDILKSTPHPRWMTMS